MDRVDGLGIEFRHFQDGLTMDGDLATVRQFEHDDSPVEDDGQRISRSGQGGENSPTFFQYPA